MLFAVFICFKSPSFSTCFASLSPQRVLTISPDFTKRCRVEKAVKESATNNAPVILMVPLDMAP